MIPDDTFTVPYPGREKPALTATQELAISLATRVEPIAQLHDLHVALSGGTLYDTQEGKKHKDIDLIFYSHDGYYVEMNAANMVIKLEQVLQLVITEDFGRVVKGKWEGHVIDLIFPERPYVQEGCGLDY